MAASFSSFPVFNSVQVLNLTTSAASAGSQPLSDVDGANIIAAVNTVLPTFCKDWGVATAFTAKYVTTTAALAMTNASTLTNSYTIFITDNSGLTDAYSAISGSLKGIKYPYSRVFAQDTMITRSGAFTYDGLRTLPTLAQAISAEIYAMILDPFAQYWSMDNTNGLLYAYEPTDAVRGINLIVRLPLNVNVTISDWVLPSWYDINNTNGPFNHTDSLSAPFTTTAYAEGGYLLFGHGAFLWIAHGTGSFYASHLSLISGTDRYIKRAAAYTVILGGDPIIRDQTGTALTIIEAIIPTTGGGGGASSGEENTPI